MTLRQTLDRDIAHCVRCPRLRAHCEEIAQKKRKSYQTQTYWGRPVPPFGPTDARLVIMGLAPGAHGANRTGRIFTGDRSGDWLYRALYRMGFANQPSSTHRDDGLVLQDAVVTCAVKCAPPDNKPSSDEILECAQTFVQRELALYNNACVYVALGSLAWNSLWGLLEQPSPRVSFAHGKVVPLKNVKNRQKKHYLVGSYHPSQQNTFTGRLTEAMFDDVFKKARELLDH